MMKIIKLFMASIVLINWTIFGQDSVKTKKAEKKAERNEVEQVLKAYTVCNFDDELRISEVDRMYKNTFKVLARQTASGVFDKSIATGKSEDQMIITDDGNVYEGVSISDGYRLMIDYRKPDFFANIRIERSPPEKYDENKEVLIRWIEFLNKVRNDSETRFAQETYYNNLEAYSINRKEVGVRKNELGLTILFDNKNKIMITIYLLNQRPEYRMHKSTEEWKTLREKFLNRYTKCVQDNLNQKTVEKK